MSKSKKTVEPWTHIRVRVSTKAWLHLYMQRLISAVERISPPPIEVEGYDPDDRINPLTRGLSLDAVICHAMKVLDQKHKREKRASAKRRKGGA